jgi:hypothetical protein
MGSMSWIHLAHDRNQWRALVNTAKKKTFRAAQKARNLLTSGQAHGTWSVSLLAGIPDFLRSSGSGTGSTQPREDN